MKLFFRYFIFIFLSSCWFNLFSIDKNSSELIKNTQQLSFVENKGQMKDENGNPTPFVLFKTEAPGINIWVTTTGLTYQFIKSEEDKQEGENFGKKEKIKYEWNRVDMIFKNASIKKENFILEENNEVVVGLRNYYLPHCSNGIVDVKTFSKIIIKNIYEGIDWVLYTHFNSSLKQDFVIHPNADPNQIKLIYEGNGKFEMKNNQIHFENSIGELQEGKLFCYQNNKEIISNYIVQKNESFTNLGAGNFLTKQPTTSNQQLFSYDVSIQLSNYDKSKMVVIDPQLVWGTFYGGATSYDGSHNICADNSGNIFITGYLNSSDFPVLNPGAGAYYQNTHGGGNFDMFIMKFSNTGIHRWTTYYGGSNDDEGLGICADQNGNVFISGYTMSNDFPLQNAGGGAYYQTAFQSAEAVILKFTNNGNRVWSTFYGGQNSDEWGRAICLDGTGNVYVTGFTNSSNFPLLSLAGAFNQAAAGGFKDAFVLKFTNAGVRQWATYIGGSANDDGYSINVDNANNIYVTGFTKSTNFPLANPGGGAYYQSVYGGSFSTGFGGTGDAFITKFSPAGVLTWSTYYGGSLDEAGHSIRTDKQGNVFAAGITTSFNLPVQNAGGGAYYQGGTGSSGLDDAYILKFTNAGVRTWATYFGGNSNESNAAFDSKVNLNIDSCENVYLAFTTESSNLTTKVACDAGYFKGTLTGPSDLFISKFSNLGVQLWGTYIGGSGNDFRMALATDNNNNLFATGEWTGVVMTNSTYPLVNGGAGTYYDATHNGDDDVYIMKFKPTVVVANAVSTDANCCTGTATLSGTGGCAPYQYLWYDSNWSLIGNSQTISNICAGTFYGVLRDSMSCSIGDTASVIIVELGTPPNVTGGPTQNIGCLPSSTVVITASSTTGGVTYVWAGPGIVSGGNTSSATVNAAGTYTVTVDDGTGCTTTTTVVVTNNNPLPAVTPGSSITLTCSTTSGTIYASSTTSGVSYSWSGPGIVSGGTNDSVIVNSPGTYTVTVTDGSGCSKTDSVIVNSNTTLPTVTPGASVTIYCSPTTGIVTATTSVIGATYSWAGTGIVSGANTDSAIVNAAGTYTITITNPSNGCTNTATVVVTADTTRPNLTPGPPVNVTTCVSINATVTASSTTSGVTYNWSGPGISSGGTTSSATVNALGTYTVIITDPSTGCTNTGTVTVNTTTNLPNVTPGPTLTITSCINISGNINATSTTPGVTYSWSGPGISSGGTTSAPTINALGTYTVTVTDPSTGCTSTATVLVNSNPILPTVNSSPIVIPCNQSTGVLNATSTTSGVTYTWSGAGIVSGGNTASPTVSAYGVYTVIVTDPATGCTNSTTANVSPPPPPIAGVSANVTINRGDSTLLTASGGVSYIWYPINGLSSSVGNPIWAKPLQTTTYCVEVTDNNGCKDTACVTVSVEIPCPTNQNLQVPNAFSPNKDGINEEFCLMGWEVCLKEFQVIIMDRWGEKVFESKDPNFCWDGYFRNNIMDAQVFVYYIKAKFINMDEPIVKKGNISLIR